MVSARRAQVAGLLSERRRQVVELEAVAPGFVEALRQRRPPASLDGLPVAAFGHFVGIPAFWVEVGGCLVGVSDGRRWAFRLVDPSDREGFNAAVVGLAAQDWAGLPWFLCSAGLRDAAGLVAGFPL